jgi:hypothetical protein
MKAFPRTTRFDAVKCGLQVVPAENMNGKKKVEAGDLCERKNGEPPRKEDAPFLMLTTQEQLFCTGQSSETPSAASDLKGFQMSLRIFAIRFVLQYSISRLACSKCCCLLHYSQLHIESTP